MAFKNYQIIVLIYKYRFINPNIKLETINIDDSIISPDLDKMGNLPSK